MELDVKIGSVRLKNPIILGSAGYTAKESGIKNHIRKGYGAVVTKTFTKEPREGAPTPRVFWYDPEEKTLLSGDEALRNPGVDKAAEAIYNSRDVALENNCPIIGSVAGSSIDEIVYVSKALVDAGVKIIEINMICPATGPHLGEEYTNLGKYWVETSEKAIQVIKAVKNAVDVPVWPKITLQKLLDPNFIAELDEKAKPDAYSYVGGRMPTLMIDVNTGKPLFSGSVRLKIEQKMPILPISVGGPTKGITILNTAYLSKLTKTPLVPSGGLTLGNHILQCLMVGAAAVQICTIVYKDKNILKKMLLDINNFVEEKGIDSISVIIGESLQYIPSPPLLQVPEALG